MEIYLTCKKYPKYEVSNYGNIRNKRTGTVRKLTDRRGYKKLRINNKDVSIHRLVADTFFDGDHDGLQVNHIDGNKSNNQLGNLEWVTSSENVKHAYATDLKQHSGGTPPIKIKDKTSGVIYESSSECARAIRGTCQGIIHAIRHNGGKYKNYILEEVL